MKKAQVDADGVITETQTPFLRTAFNYNMDIASERHGLDCPEKTLTQQQFAEEVNINTIVERFGVTGELPENIRVPQEGDFEGVTDYQTAMNIVRAAQEAFMEMPAGVRARFHNNPQEFLEFTNDPANRDEAARLGILAPPKVPDEPMKVRVVPDPAAVAPGNGDKGVT